MLNGYNGGLVFYVRLRGILKSILGGGCFLQRRPRGGVGLLQDEAELRRLSWVQLSQWHKQSTRAPRFGNTPKLRNSFLVTFKDWSKYHFPIFDYYIQVLNKIWWKLEFRGTVAYIQVLNKIWWKLEFRGTVVRFWNRIFVSINPLSYFIFVCGIVVPTSGLLCPECILATSNLNNNQISKENPGVV